MKFYEVMFILKPTSDEDIRGSVDWVEGIINNNNGNVTKTDMWGKKRLAYEIQDLAEGYYVLISFEAESECCKELDRLLKINEDVLRYMIVRRGE